MRRFGFELGDEVYLRTRPDLCGRITERRWMSGEAAYVIRVERSSVEAGPFREAAIVRLPRFESLDDILAYLQGEA